VVTLSVLTIAWVLARPSASPVPAAAPSAEGFAGPAPDISTLSAREGFDRLFNRVMEAAEQGDTAAATRFAAHALGAYSQLDSVDLDARYHAAALHTQLGQYAEALALADSMVAQVPNHLLAWVIRGGVAEARADQAGLAEARRAFLAAWKADPKRDRPEYRDHQKALDDFRTSAGTS
jgi:tetratricopeptide (TPR) repeat protein